VLGRPGTLGAHRTTAKRLAGGGALGGAAPGPAVRPRGPGHRRGRPRADRAGHCGRTAGRALGRRRGLFAVSQGLSPPAAPRRGWLGWGGGVTGRRGWSRRKARRDGGEGTALAPCWRGR